MCLLDSRRWGVVGKAPRPELNKLMVTAKRRRFDAVLVWKFDRFARSVKHLVTSLYEFKALGIDFVSLTEGIDTSTPLGEAMFSIIGAMALKPMMYLLTKKCQPL